MRTRRTALTAITAYTLALTCLTLLAPSTALARKSAAERLVEQSYAALTAGGPVKYPRQRRGPDFVSASKAPTTP